MHFGQQVRCALRLNPCGAGNRDGYTISGVAIFCFLQIMSLGCLACRSVDSPTHSFRSYSASSADNEGRCAAMVSCLTRTTNSLLGNAKVAPLSSITNAQGMAGAPRLVRSCAVTRDLVRDWNFDELLLES
ncbi:hypothetical protein M5K25_012813 [Dendrobium thyrsiflorum]|uniref:Secreted protein n=1 Tax=Dendrobium thyrsiflorum TaxID=117978 RepID=A0ABD0V5Q4_DENTH